MNKLSVNINSKQFSSADRSTPRQVLANLQFELSNNEFVCMIGPSGCGKTSLLNIIAGLDHDFDGSVTINNGSSALKTSYIFQTPRLLPWRTVLENIQLASNNPVAGTQEIIQLLADLGLQDSLHSYPQQLSLGMQRRVALARGFCTQSDILLMDEPFVSLDPPTARKARTLLLKLWHEQPRNILFVTHDVDEAIQLADRLLFVSGSPSHILASIKIDMPRAERTPLAINNFKQQLKTSNDNIAALI